MVVVDSSVWIDFFADHVSAQRSTLRELLDHGETRIVVPDLVLFEVLRGFRHERHLRQARLLMQSLDVETIGGKMLALAAAEHYRALRDRGYTIRSGIDVLLAAFCIENDYTLLHRDRDFDAMASLRGLKVWKH